MGRGSLPTSLPDAIISGPLRWAIPESRSSRSFPDAASDWHFLGQSKESTWPRESDSRPPSAAGFHLYSIVPLLWCHRYSSFGLREGSRVAFGSGLPHAVSIRCSKIAGFADERLRAQT